MVFDFLYLKQYIEYEMQNVFEIHKMNVDSQEKNY